MNRKKKKTHPCKSQAKLYNPNALEPWRHWCKENKRKQIFSPNFGEKITWIFMSVSVPYTWSSAILICSTLVLKKQTTKEMSKDRKNNKSKSMNSLLDKPMRLFQKWNPLGSCFCWAKQFHSLLFQQLW